MSARAKVLWCEAKKAEKKTIQVDMSAEKKKRNIVLWCFCDA